MDSTLKSISDSMIDRYSQRYNKLGYHVNTLGWGNTEQQEYRFSQTLDLATGFKDKKVLDIGCGFGDYLTFMRKSKVPVGSYVGYDLNPDLIKEAKIQHADDDTAQFEVANILETSRELPLADVAMMLGVLNLNLKGQVDNYEYSQRIIRNAFSLVKDCLVVDFLSTVLDKSYPKEDFVFYHNPVKMLEFALSLSPKVTIKQDYKPIPQREFMIFIYK